MLRVNYNPPWSNLVVKSVYSLQVKARLLPTTPSQTQLEKVELSSNSA